MWFWNISSLRKTKEKKFSLWGNAMPFLPNDFRIENLGLGFPDFNRKVFVRDVLKLE